MYVGKNQTKFFIRILLIELLIFLYNAMACTVIFDSTSSDYDFIKKDIMYVHNFYRNTFVSKNTRYPTATYMLYVEWDEELARKAQEVAAKCPAVSKCEVCENRKFKIIQIFYNQDLPKSEGPFSKFRDLATREKDDVIKQRLFDPTTIKLTNEKVAGFWGNIIRAATWKVGCGASYKPIDENIMRLWYICNYRIIKSSNTDGRLYEPGEHSCDNCPKNTACNIIKTYPMLCAAEEDKIPKIGTEPNLLLNCELKLNEDSEDCSIGKSCFGEWLKSQHENDIVKKIRLNKNEFSSIIFSKIINLENGGCFIFEYLYENIPNDYVIIVFGYAIKANDENNIVKTKTFEKVTEWNTVSLNIPWQQEEIKVGVAVQTASTENSEHNEQTTIMIKNPKVYDGFCTIQ